MSHDGALMLVTTAGIPGPFTGASVWLVGVDGRRERVGTGTGVAMSSNGAWIVWTEATHLVLRATAAGAQGRDLGRNDRFRSDAIRVTDDGTVTAFRVGGDANTLVAVDPGQTLETARDVGSVPVRYPVNSCVATADATRRRLTVTALLPARASAWTRTVRVDGIRSAVAACVTLPDGTAITPIRLTAGHALATVGPRTLTVATVPARWRVIARRDGTPGMTIDSASPDGRFLTLRTNTPSRSLYVVTRRGLGVLHRVGNGKAPVWTADSRLVLSRGNAAQGAFDTVRRRDLRIPTSCGTGTLVAGLPVLSCTLGRGMRLVPGLPPTLFGPRFGQGASAATGVAPS